MNGFGLRRNTIFNWSGDRFRIDRIQADGDLLLERTDAGIYSVVARKVILSEYAKGKISTKISGDAVDGLKVYARPLDELSPDILREVKRRHHYLRAITENGRPVFTKDYLAPIIASASIELGDKNPPSVTSLYRWHKKFTRYDDNRALIPRFDLRGTHSTKQSATILQYASTAIEDAYKASPLATVPDIYARLVTRVNAHNAAYALTDHINPPSLSTLYRLISRIDAYDRTTLREGKASADKRFRLVHAGPKTERILERVEIDHTPLDLFLIDEKTHLPLGRPTLTVIVDHFSRMLLGFHLSFGHPSSAAVMGALRHAILPKTPVKEALPHLKSEHTWVCYGLPDSLVADNGPEFHAKDIESVAFDLGINIQFCPKHEPRFKGTVERYLKTVNYFFAHQLPGTSFSRWHLRGDYDPLKHAVLTLAEFHHLFEKWVVDVYAQTVHQGIGMTPWAKWHEGLVHREPELPDDVRTLQRRIGQISERSLRHDGITLNGIRYNGDALAPIFRRYGAGVRVRVLYDAEDLGEIQVWGPDETEPIAVKAIDFDFARGLTELQNDMIRQYMREQGAATEDRASLYRARSEIAIAVDELMKSRKQGDRRNAAKIRGISSSKSETVQDDAPKIKTQKFIPPTNTVLPQLLPSFQLKRKSQDEL